MYLKHYIKELEELMKSNPGSEYFNVKFKENGGETSVIVLTEDLQNVKMKLKSKINGELSRL